MAEPDLNRGEEEFASAEGRNVLEFEQEPSTEDHSR